MQELFKIQSTQREYSVELGAGSLVAILGKYPNAIFIIDQRLAGSLPPVISNKILIEATENNKSLEKMPEIIVKLRELRANRSSLVVVIGGGVIQDIATFVTSIYMRGISWIYLPTTLLGMVDSCVGGKSSINVEGYKNLLGNYFPPEAVIIDTHFLKTLNSEQIGSGLLEAAKICYAKDCETFKQYLEADPQLLINENTAQKIISISLTTKKWFIEIDEFDKNERLLLNFGHTFGHALEAGTCFGIPHGIAVGVGMIIAIEYSKSAMLLSDRGLERANVLASHIRSLTGKGLKNVMVDLPKMSIPMIMQKFNNDKKHQTDFFRIICPHKDGDLRVTSRERGEGANVAFRDAFIAGLRAVDYPKTLITG